MKKLLILSGKGGTGKTTTAAAFIAFSKAKAIADCDVDAPNLHIVTETSDEPEITDFIGSEKAKIDEKKCIGCGKCLEYCRFNAISKKGSVYEIKEYACEGCGVCEYVCENDAVKLVSDVAGEKMLYKGDTTFSTAKLKMGRGNSGKLVAEVKKAMLKNCPDTDLAIIDGSPGIGCPVISSISGVSLVLVVAEPSLSGISDLERLVKTANTLNTKLAVCLNKWNTCPENTEKIERFCEEREIPFVGKLPYDKTASEAINKGKSVAEIDCPLRYSLFKVYENIVHILENK